MPGRRTISQAYRNAKGKLAAMQEAAKGKALGGTLPEG
jgi:hypothetical protein